MKNRLIWLLAALVGAVLITSAAAKVIGHGELQHLLEAVEINPMFASVISALLPGIEFSLGLALVLGWRSLTLHVLVIVLCSTFVGFLLVLSQVDPKAHCPCFAGVLGKWSGSSAIEAIVRDAVLIALLLPQTYVVMRAACRVSDLNREGL